MIRHRVEVASRSHFPDTHSLGVPAIGIVYAAICALFLAWASRSTSLPLARKMHWKLLNGDTRLRVDLPPQLQDCLVISLVIRDIAREGQ